MQQLFCQIIYSNSTTFHSRHMLDTSSDISIPVFLEPKGFDNISFSAVKRGEFSAIAGLVGCTGIKTVLQWRVLEAWRTSQKLEL